MKENQENNNFFLKSYEFEIRPRRHYLGYSLVAISCGMGLYPKSDLRIFGELHIKKLSSMAKNEENPCSTCILQGTMGTLTPTPKPEIRVRPVPSHH